jgi:hypothetical protein
VLSAAHRGRRAALNTYKPGYGLLATDWKRAGHEKNLNLFAEILRSI